MRYITIQQVERWTPHPCPDKPLHSARFVFIFLCFLFIKGQLWHFGTRPHISPVWHAINTVRQLGTNVFSKAEYFFSFHLQPAEVKVPILSLWPSWESVLLMLNIYFLKILRINGANHFFAASKNIWVTWEKKKVSLQLLFSWFVQWNFSDGLK